jgi:hypothetical protein
MLTRTLAGQKSKHQSRKRRTPGVAPRAVPSDRREERGQRGAARERELRRAQRPGTRGQRPEGPFGGLPVSEIAIFAGLIALVIGLIEGAQTPLVVGSIICALGVVEVTGREHFAGYRSHTVLLAAIPAIALEAGLVAVFGEPRPRGLLLLVVVPVFGVLFLMLKRRFESARQARVARPPMA